MSWMPTLAIFTYELRGFLASWLVRLWFVATALWIFIARGGKLADRLSPAPLIASLLFSYLVFPWFLVVIMLGISPMTGSRFDALADGILCRPVTRYEYLLASWGARVVVVLAVYLASWCRRSRLLRSAKRPLPDDGVTLYGVLASLGVVALVLTFLVTLSFLAGTLLRRSLLAVVVLIFRLVSDQPGACTLSRWKSFLRSASVRHCPRCCAPRGAEMTTMHRRN